MIDMTTWDRYKQELLSGVLEWSPAHKSEKFWKGNESTLNCFLEVEHHFFWNPEFCLRDEFLSGICCCGCCVRFFWGCV